MAPLPTPMHICHNKDLLQSKAKEFQTQRRHQV